MTRAFADLRSKFPGARRASAAKSEWLRKHEERRCEWERQEADLAREFMLEQLRPAQPHEYAAWLKGCLRAGARPSHLYDFIISEADVWVATRDLVILPLYGARSLDIIVPEGVHEDGSDTGHIHLFITRRKPSGKLEYVQRESDDPVAGAPEFIPVYSDTVL